LPVISYASDADRIIVGAVSTATTVPYTNQMVRLFPFVHVDQPASVTCQSWKDANADGVRQPTEVGAAPKSLVLLNSTGRAVADPVFDQSGFSFQWDVLPGASVVAQVTPPIGWALSPADQGTDESLDSDFDPFSDQSPPVIALPGQSA